MKVAIGYQVVDGPWGGGNRFVSALAESLVNKGHIVVYSLQDDDIDLILMIDPRARLENIPFGAGAIIRYLLLRNKNAVVVHRINECDERKNTKTVNFRLRLANYVADHTIFVGSWLKELGVWFERDHSKSSVILNGAEPKVFHSIGQIAWDGDEPLKLVTHHWGGNWMKGFDVYQRIDEMLSESHWKDRIRFTYIGNIPKGFEFQNATLIEPLDSSRLANELRNHHVYVTASMNEPGGNHQNEGALCGLPLIFRNSGSMPEYCSGYGLMFEGLRDFEIVLDQMTKEYSNWKERITQYPHRIDQTIANYLKLFEDLCSNRSEILADRKLWSNLPLLLLNQIKI